MSIVKTTVVDFEYNFEEDSDFILVKYVEKTPKDLNSSTYTRDEFRSLYGIMGYGVKKKGDIFWILITDYERNPHFYEVASVEAAPIVEEEIVEEVSDEVSTNFWGE